MVFEEGFREVGRSLAAGRQLVREGVESAEAVLGGKKTKKIEKQLDGPGGGLEVKIGTFGQV